MDFQKYDSFIVKTINELIQCHEANKGLVLDNFDRKKISHLYFFEIARMVDSFSEGFTCKCKSSFWERLFHKKYYNLIKNSADAPNFNIDSFIQTVIDLEGVDISIIDEIYNAYYSTKR